MAAPPARTRRTQSERSEEMQARLSRAAFDIVAEEGLAALTYWSLADRAGVSRGAAMHHFPTKDDLVAATLLSVRASGWEDFERIAAALPDGGAERICAALDGLFEIFHLPVFQVILELVTRARTDEALHRRVVGAIDAIYDELAERAPALFGLRDPDPERLAATMRYVIATVRGLALTHRLGPVRTGALSVGYLREWKFARAVLEDVVRAAERSPAAG